MNESSIQEYLGFVKNLGYSTSSIITSSPTKTVIECDSKTYINFSSNNYLGVADHPKVKEGVRQAIEKYGLGSGGSRLVTGNTEIQEELERRIAKFKGEEAAITFATGYMANLGSIKPLVNPLKFKSGVPVGRFSGSIISDELNHVSIIEASKLTDAKKYIYKHLDVEDLKRKIKKTRANNRVIITESLYSMDGDIAPVPEICSLAKDYGCFLIIDDAHGTGTLGAKGRGVLEHYGISHGQRGVLTVGTFTKAFGGFGGFVVGNKDIIDYIRFSARSYIFTAPIPPIIVAGLIAAFDVVEEEERLDRLRSNIQFLRSQLESSLLLYSDRISPIVPVIIGDERRTIQISTELLSLGFFVRPIVWPAVPKGKARLRITVTSEHKHEQLLNLATSIIKLMA